MGIYIDPKFDKATSHFLDLTGDIRSPFHSQLTILQNAINKWYTLRDNFSDLHAETLSQTGVSCSYVPYVIIAKYVPFQRHFYDNKKKANFFIVC